MIKTSKEARTVWTDEQIEIVKQNYSTMPQNHLLALLPDKTWNAVKYQAQLQGLKREKWDRPSQDWTQEQLDCLKQYYPIETEEWLCSKIGKDWGTIQNKASYLALKRIRKDAWTKEEKEKLLELREEGYKLEELESELGRTQQAIQRQLRLFGATKRDIPRKNQKFGYKLWNEEANVLLKQYYVDEKKLIEEISAIMNRSVASIRNQLNKLKIGRLESSTWTSEEDEYLKEYYPKSPQQQIEQHIGRAWSAIQKRATSVLKLSRRGVVKKGQWTEEEQQLLIKFCREKASPEEIQEVLPNRSWQSIYAQATRRLKHLNLELSKPRVWTSKEEELLEKHYHNLEMVKLLKKLPRHNVNGIYARANQLGLERKKIRYYREELMKYFLDQLLPEEERQDNIRPDFLEGLEYDRYYPNLKLAFEYNGIQHYEPMSDSGESQIAFEKQQERDQYKRELSETNDIHLIVIRYDEDLTLDLIRNRLRHLRERRLF